MTLNDLRGQQILLKKLALLMLAFIEILIKIGSLIKLIERKKLIFQSLRIFLGDVEELTLLITGFAELVRQSIQEQSFLILSNN